MISSQRYHGPRVSRQGSGTGAAEPSVGSRHSQRVRDRTPSDWREPSMAKSEYGEGDYVVYPTHGVGRVLGVETQQVADITLDLIVIKFAKDRMTLRVPEIGRESCRERGCQYV